MTVSARRQPLGIADQIEITELFARYAWTLDTGDSEGFANLFTADGVFDGIRGIFNGRDQLRRIADGMKSPEYLGTQHWVGNSLFTGTAVRCNVTSMCFAPRHIGGELSIGLVGYYVDECVKVKKRWMFARRQFRPWTGIVI